MGVKKIIPADEAGVDHMVTQAMELLEHLQFKQLQHDELYHTDICLLRIQARIAHHTLHMGKYAGKMGQALVAKNPEDAPCLIRTVLDALIIVMSSSNTLNLALWKIPGACPDFQAALAGRKVPGSEQSHVIGFVILVGKLAKAVEALDHVESYNSRQAFEETLKALWVLLLKFWICLTDEKLDAALKTRIEGIESRNCYYRRMPKYVDDFRPVNLVKS